MHTEVSWYLKLSFKWVSQETDYVLHIYNIYTTYMCLYVYVRAYKHIIYHLPIYLSMNLTVGPIGKVLTIDGSRQVHCTVFSVFL